MIIKDAEFGDIIVRKNALVRGAKFSVSTSGRLQMSVASSTSRFLIKRILESSRSSIRQLPLKNPATQRARDAKKNSSPNRPKPTYPTGSTTMPNYTTTTTPNSASHTPIQDGAAASTLALC